MVYLTIARARDGKEISCDRLGRLLGVAGCLALPLFAAFVVLLQELAPMGILLRIRFDGTIAPLVLLFAMRLTVERMAASYRCSTLLAEPLRLLRLGFEHPCR